MLQCDQGVYIAGKAGPEYARAVSRGEAAVASHGEDKWLSFRGRGNHRAGYQLDLIDGPFAQKNKGEMQRLGSNPTYVGQRIMQWSRRVDQIDPYRLGQAEGNKKASGQPVIHRYIQFLSSPNRISPARRATPCEARLAQEVLYSGMRPASRMAAPQAAVTAEA